MIAPSTDAMKSAGTGKQVGALGVVLLALIVLMAVNFALVARQNAFDKQYIEHAGEMRILSQEIAKNSTEAVTGKAEAFRFLQEARQAFERHLELLRVGNGATGLPASPPEATAALGRVRETWGGVSGAADVIIGRWDVITTLHEIAGRFSETIPRLQKVTDELVDAMAASDSAREQLILVSRQSLLLERIVRNVNLVLRGGLEAVTAADSFGRDTALFGRVLNGLLEGSPALGITAVAEPAQRARLEELQTLFAPVSESAGRILESSPELFQVRDAADRIFQNSGLLLDGATDLETVYENLGAQRVISAWTGFGILAVAILVLVLLAQRYVRDSRLRLQASTEQNQRNQEAILRLLDEMGDLADGDLTVQATVTEDFTGAIADSVNYAVEQLRSLVSAINSTAVQVASASQETRTTAANLAEASRHQAKEISAATATINDMAVSIEGVSENASESAQVSRRAVEIANKGHQTVQNTIHGMDNIREHIQETAKRIKRLGESSQEIGNIVSLINDIAEQTNILALNAAIQAATAGEAGRGFAVVADEVQRLAERSGNATKQIEALVKTIQTDTNEAVISMEQSTTEVVGGARLAEEAGVALEEIDAVSKHLAELIESISAAARQQSTSASQASQTMKVIEEITSQTLTGANATAESIGKLADLAGGLRNSVADFRLPAEGGGEQEEEVLAAQA
ncbi:MAG: methyl-accepting chemotaxis protein [Gammaproteobacteria bacterium]|nr:methyl-accepting chemotaxis protein [Gammaproteobacteria bacterium]